MGSGRYDPSVYASVTAPKVASGTSFGYTSTTRATTPRSAWKTHEDLDPKKVAGAGSLVEGQTIRESRDSTEHPTSTPVAVFFDDTGSMGAVPRVVQTKLTGLFGLLGTKGYLEHPQLMVGAYGDCEVDQVPLQVSQFESDNRVDDALDKLFLEGGGGGNNGESQAIAWYYLAHHTATDALEKRGKKGYAFFIGDEKVINLRPEHVKECIGDGEPLGKLDHKSLVNDLLEKWDAYVLLIDNGSARSQRSYEFYTELFGTDRVLVVQDEASIAETIALTIGTREGVVDLDEGMDDLRSIGASDAAIKSAGAALVSIGATGGKGLGDAVISRAPSDINEGSDSATRL